MTPHEIRSITSLTVCHPQAYRSSCHAGQRVVIDARLEQVSPLVKVPVDVCFRQLVSQNSVVSALLLVTATLDKSAHLYAQQQLGAKDCLEHVLVLFAAALEAFLQLVQAGGGAAR